MQSINKNIKLLFGSMAIGAGVGLVVRQWRKRRRRRKAEESFKTVVLFSLEPLIQTGDHEWESLSGRVVFKQICAKLALAGYPPSDVGDIEEAHQCVLHVDGDPIFLTMKDGEGDREEWAIYVSRSLGTGQKLGPAPKDSKALRDFLRELGYAVNALQDSRDVRWRKR
jgi:hypothetical protein